MLRAHSGIKKLSETTNCLIYLSTLVEMARKDFICAGKGLGQEAGKWDKPHVKEGFLLLYRYLECFVIYIITQDKLMVHSVPASSKRNWRCETCPASFTRILKSLITWSYKKYSMKCSLGKPESHQQLKKESPSPSPPS